ncbi:response regulator [bacterium]|jgi:two-component system, chemotaxis family, response regulator Rcp1|nr:response regulator [bacterium]
MALSLNSRVEILLVEDNPGDVRLAKTALKEAEFENHISVAKDGVEALSFLRQEGQFEQAPRPDIILLDLNLPRKSGHEVLEEIKADENLKRIPVVVLSTSSSEEDVSQSYYLRANCYVSKPVDLDEYLETLKTIGLYWSSVVTLPIP